MGKWKPILSFLLCNGFGISKEQRGSGGGEAGGEEKVFPTGRLSLPNIPGSKRKGLFHQ